MMMIIIIISRQQLVVALSWQLFTCQVCGDRLYQRLVNENGQLKLNITPAPPSWGNFIGNPVGLKCSWLQVPVTRSLQRLAVINVPVQCQAMHIVQLAFYKMNSSGPRLILAVCWNTTPWPLWLKSLALMVVHGLVNLTGNAAKYSL